MTDRPGLTPRLPVSDFRDFYWLKEELAAFCRQNGLPIGGSKVELAARVEQFLTDRTILPDPGRVKSRKAGAMMPDILTRAPLIGPNWRCTEQLRAFFVDQIGPGFHFNGIMRDLIQNGAGKTLQDAIDAWITDRKAPREESELAPQFEYNCHMREFFKNNPGKTRQEAIAAWKEKRARRNSTPEL
jgi:hypothetical protein